MESGLDRNKKIIARRLLDEYICSRINILGGMLIYALISRKDDTQQFLYVELTGMSLPIKGTDGSTLRWLGVLPMVSDIETKMEWIESTFLDFRLCTDSFLPHGRFDTLYSVYKEDILSIYTILGYGA